MQAQFRDGWMDGWIFGNDAFVVQTSLKIKTIMP